MRFTRERSGVWVLAAAVAVAIAAGAVCGQTNMTQTTINADKLDFDYTDGVIDLKGQVVVRDMQGTLYADNATVYLDRDAGGEAETSAEGEDMGSFNRVVAYGNVRMSAEDKSAVSDKAVWTRDDNRIVLTGGRPMVRQGSSYIRATRIVYHVDTRQCEFYPNPKIVFNIKDDDKKRFTE